MRLQQIADVLASFFHLINKPNSSRSSDLVDVRGCESFILSEYLRIGFSGFIFQWFYRSNSPLLATVAAKEKASNANRLIYLITKSTRLRDAGKRFMCFASLICSGSLKPF